MIPVQLDILFDTERTPVFTPMTLLRSLFCVLVLVMASGQALGADACAPAGPGYFHKYYSGKIADKYAFRMDLKCQDGALTGSYRYTGKDLPIYLQGKADAGSFSMQESYGYAGKTSGVFTGTLAGTRISGTWKSGDGKKTLQFAAEQTSEIRVGSKKEILGTAVGDYVLESIEGSGGASAMWSTWKNGGRWQSSISSTSAGRREVDEVTLDRTDIRLLDSLTIRVRPDLTTRRAAAVRIGAVEAVDLGWPSRCRLWTCRARHPC
jgi:hypothetical protein